MRKKVSVLFAMMSFCATLFVFSLSSADAKMIADGNKSLAQKDSGAYCCADTELGSCSSSPDC